MIIVIGAFAILVVVGALFYAVGQDIAGWLIAVFASGMAGVITAEFIKRQEERHEKTDLGGDANAGSGGTVSDSGWSGQGLPGPGGSGAGDPGDVERSRGGGAVHRRGKTHWSLYVGLVLGWRRRR